MATSPKPWHAALLIIVLGGALLYQNFYEEPDSRPVQIQYHGEIPVGIIHSLTGTMAISEDPVISGEILAIEEINSNGGVTLNEKQFRLVPHVRDGESNSEKFLEHAQNLVSELGVRAVFGGWTSASRNAMAPVFASNDALLLYPIQYEGGSSQRNVMYFGATPNQQALPAIKWFFDSGFKSFFLIGSDYVYPRSVHKVIAKYLESLDAQVAGELYIPLGGVVGSEDVDEILKGLPSGGVIVNTINGDSNESFFEQLQMNYLLPHNGYQTLSFSVDEAIIEQYGSKKFEGSYLSQGFFQDLKTNDASNFVSKFQQRFGEGRPIGEPAATGFSMVKAWALAVQDSGSLNPAAVMQSMKALEFESPAGPFWVQGQNVTKRPVLARVSHDGRMIFEADLSVIEPDPLAYQ